MCYNQTNITKGEESWSSKGKNAFLGDSITEGWGVFDRENCRYDNRLKAACSLAATYNYGIYGTRLANKHVPSANPRQDLCFCGRACDIAPDVEFLVTLLKENYSSAQLVFMTPARRQGDERISPQHPDGADGRVLLDYVDIIKEVCATHDVPVLDLYRMLGFGSSLM